MFDLNLSKMKKSSWTAKCSYWGNVLKSFFFESFWNLFKILQKYVDRIDGLIKLEPVSLQIYWKFKFITKVNFEFKFPYSSPRIWLGIVLELSVQKCQLQIMIAWSQCVKSVPIRSFSGPYFSAFGLNTERYSVSLCIQSKCRKTRTRKLPIQTLFTQWASYPEIKINGEIFLKE